MALKPPRLVTFLLALLMIPVLLLAVQLFLPNAQRVFLPKALWAATTWYVSPSGSGSACTIGSPCTVQQALTSNAVSGDTIMVNDGTYTGTTQQVLPPNGLNNITFQAINDGAALFDGQGARTPVQIGLGSPSRVNTGWIIQGIKACCSSTSAASGVVSVVNGSTATIKRVTAWKANTGWNSQIFNIDGNGTGSVCEDCAGWGFARKIFQVHNGNTSGFTTNFTCRRCYADWDASLNQGPKKPMALHYQTKGNTCENCISRWHANDTTYGMSAATSGTCGYQLLNNGVPVSPTQTFSNCDVEQPNVIDAICTSNTSGCKSANYSMLGSVFFSLASDDTHSFTTQFNESQLFNVTYKDVVGAVYVAGKRGVALQNCSQAGCENATGFTGQGITNISPVSMLTGSQWTPTNTVDVTTLGATNVYNGASGANLCFQYSGGTLTGTQLWPWPMQDRILTDSVASGHDPIDVNALMQTMFGQIPAACGGPQATPTPSNTPTNTPTPGGPTATPTPVSPICTQDHIHRYPGGRAIVHSHPVPCTDGTFVRHRHVTPTRTPTP